MEKQVPWDWFRLFAHTDLLPAFRAKFAVRFINIMLKGDRNI